jgi:hypothetical protein
MSRIFGPEGEKKNRGGEKCVAMIIIRVNISKRMRWARHIIPMGSIKNAHKSLVLEAEEE